MVLPDFVMIVAALLLTTAAGRGTCTEDSPLQRRMASHGSARAFGADKYPRTEEFNLLQSDYQIRATLKPNNVSQFYYLSSKTGPPPTLLVSPCSGPIYWSVSYVGPPETDQHAEGSKPAQTHWPVKQMVPGSPLFTYTGAETRNFTIPAVQANLYRIEMSPVNSTGLDLKTRSPNTVLLYATSDASGRLPGNLRGPHRGRSAHQPMLDFQQRWSRRRLIVSWNKSHVDPDHTSYLLAVTSGAHLYPPTLCAAENILKKHPCPSRLTPAAQLAQHRTEPEGLHCVRKNKITLFGLKNNTTYYFTLYIMNTQNNVSSLVAMDSFKFQRKPPITLKNGHYISADLRDRDGFVIFRYRPRDNTSTIFNILACGACSVKAKFRAPGYRRNAQIGGTFNLKAPALPPGRRFSIHLTVSQFEMVKLSKVKILAMDDQDLPYADNGGGGGDVSTDYRKFRKCPAKRASWCAGRISSTTTTAAAATATGSSSSTIGPCRRSPAHSLDRPCPASSSP